MWIVFRTYYRQVVLQKLVGISLTLEELTVILDIVDAWEYLFEVPQSELLLFKVQYYLQVVLCRIALLSFKQLPHQFTQVCLRWQVIKYALFFALLSIEAKKAFLE